MRKLFHQRRLLLALLLGGLTFFSSLFVLWPSTPNGEVKPGSMPFVRPNRTTVLIWYWPHKIILKYKQDFCLEHYGIASCNFVDDRASFSSAELVIFHQKELFNGEAPLPVHLARPKNQRWVWFSQESPDNNINVQELGGVFNYTMSYRRDADIYAPYGSLAKRDTEAEDKLEDLYPKEKSSLACWVVSNVSPGLRRSVIYQELKTVIPVDVYGGAVNKRLDDDSLLPTISRCYFYLAFENSVSRDYISEKFWHNALVAGAVPVVFGPPRDQYEAVVPKDSFIHVDDFRTVKELGEFLKSLAEDQERYASYFSWRKKFVVHSNVWGRSVCKACADLDSLPKQKVYKDLYAWLRE